MSDLPPRPETNWVNYLTLIEDVPSMVSVDAGWISALGYGDAETLLGIEVPMRQKAEGEIVTRDELPALQDLATAVEAELPDDFSWLVARTFGGGRMVLYVYTLAPDEVMELLAPLFEEADYAPSQFEMQDPDWAYYSDILFPDDVVWQNISNDQLLAELKEHGDDGTIPREVTHRARFPDRDTAGGFAAQISEMDHDILSFDEIEDEAADAVGLTISVDFSREDTPAKINDVTGILIHLAAGFGGEYAGWSTAVTPAESDAAD